MREKEKKSLMINFKLMEHSLTFALNAVLGVVVLGLSQPLNYISSTYAISLMRSSEYYGKTALAG